MFDIGWTELLVIAVVAIIVVGPKDLPRMRTAGEFRQQFDEAVRESELDELRSSLKEATDMNPVNQIRDSVTDSMKPLEDTARDIKSGIEKQDAASKPSGSEKPAEAAASEAAPKTAKRPRKAAVKPKPKADAGAGTKSGG